MQFNVNPLFEIDFYKAGHYAQYPKGTVEIYSNFTPRSSRTENDFVIVFGIQAVIQDIHENWKKNFFDLSEEEFEKVLAEYIQLMDASIYKGAVSPDHIRAVYKLGYMPIEILAIPEGTKVPVTVPVMTIHNTMPEAFWLVNYLETKLSNALWKPITSATTAYSYKRNFIGYGKETGADFGFINWAGHDFSYRGMSGNEDAVMSGMGHLTSFTGTDTVPAIPAIKYYYGTDWKSELVAGSVVATEHSVMCAGSKEDELGTFNRLMDTFPTGILSIVSDTWDYWKVITEYLPALKDRIMSREGRIVIRPDSGDPVRIICGYKIFDDLTEMMCCETEDCVYWNKRLERYELYEFIDYKPGEPYFENRGEISEHEAKGTFRMLWDIFGGTVNAQGYKVLDPHIGLIYGDSITIQRQEKILELLLEFGFTADNLVLGIGSFTYEYVTRDTYGMAMKATNVVKMDEDGTVTSEAIFKDPKTNTGGFTKKSAKGYLKVVRTETGLKLVDEIGFENIYDDDNVMKPIYSEGTWIKRFTLTEIRDNVNKELRDELI